MAEPGATRFALIIFARFVILKTRIALASFCALAGLALRVPAQDAVGPKVDPAAPPALAALPKWSVFASLESSFGFKDNLLLSSSAEERSAFARSATEAVVMRVPTGRLDYWLFVQAEGTHFFSGRTVENETKVWIHNELGFRFGPDWKLNLPITGYYNDNVLDQSDTEVERLAAEIKVTGVMAGPVFRWAFRPDWWVETEATAQRQRYADGSNDGRVTHAALHLGWNVNERVELRVSGNRRWRDFDSRAQYSAAGRELDGTHLKIDEDEAEFRLHLKWDRATRWQTVTCAGIRHYRDNGSGYWDYREQKVEQEVEWNDGAWLVRFNGAARRIDFGVQTVGIGISPPARRKDEYELELHVERKVTSRWTLFGGYSWERSRSNDPVTSFVVNEGLLGVRWSWEK